MPDQSEHEKLENLVDAPGQAQNSARSLQDAVDSHSTLQGFEAMNNERFSPEPAEDATETAQPAHDDGDEPQQP